MEHKELFRLIAAAVVNQRFRCQLLEDPLEAVRIGYLGQSFVLTEEEHELLVSMSVSDLPSLSQQIDQWVTENGRDADGRHRERNSYKTNGNGIHWRQAQPVAHSLPAV